MSRKGSALGRDLDFLLSKNKTDTSVKIEGKTTPREGDVRQLALEDLQRGQYQPRKDMSSEALQELADSIAQQGVIQPIIVRPVMAGRYEIIAGERRWRAAQLAGLLEVPVIIREMTDQAAMAVAIIENIQREDLNPLEKAPNKNKSISIITGSLLAKKPKYSGDQAAINGP